MNEAPTTARPPAAPERRRLRALLIRLEPRAGVTFGVLALALIWAGALLADPVSAATLAASREGLALAAALLTVVLIPLMIVVARYQGELMRARDAAESGTRARAEFLAMMSHEIRTPMNAVLGFANTLLESRLDAEQRRAAGALHEAGEHLLRLLNDVLDFSRLDSGRVVFEPIAFAPAAMTQAALAGIEPSARAKGLQLRVEIDPALPAALEGDAARIRQVLLNLLTNAVKFTARGEIVVAVRCTAPAQRSACVRWSVSDSGIGIAPERLDSVFADFVQADSAANRRFGGSGLGLAICRRIIDQMGGRIEVRSAPGRGSCFSFELTLPLSGARFETEKQLGNAAAEFSARIASFGRPLRILLAEDNPTNQLVGKQMLREFDTVIDVAANGREAVELARAFSHDVILMDLQMPEMSGIDAARAIRGLGGKPVPILALTANSDPEDVSNCLAAGMNGFVAKPVRKFVLIEAILRVLPAVPGGRVPAAFSLSFTKAGADDLLEEQAPIIDRSAVDEFIQEIGTEAAENMFNTFLAETERRLGKLRALDCDDRSAIRFEAHTLIGSSGTFSMMRLSQLARQLERACATIEPDAYRAAVERLLEVYRISRHELLDYLGQVARIRSTSRSALEN